MKRFFNVFNIALRETQALFNTLKLKSLPVSPHSICIVTAFDTSHYLSGIQLLNSLKAQGYKIEILVFDLGLDQSQIVELKQEFPFLNIRKFPFKFYPSYFDLSLDAGQYAWKPVIIATLLNQEFDHILWLDAGDKVIGSLANLNKLIDHYGFFSVPTSNSILELTHEKSIEKLRVEPLECTQLQLSAAFIGICVRSSSVNQLIRKWNDCALDKEIIAPEGSNRSNHRQDQSVFNLLILQDENLKKSARKIITRHYLPRHHHVLTHQDVESI